MGYLAGITHSGALCVLLLVVRPPAAHAQYAGSDACRECHSVEYAKQSGSAHARALAPAPPGSPGEWAFGAARKAITYVSRVDEESYVERGLSFYASTGALAPTPGHRGSSDLPYPALAPGASVARCFRCHSTGTLRLSADAAIVPAENGVHCEACHGPGTEHVKAGGGAKTIGNPGALNAVELNQFCGACHRRPPETADANDDRIAVGLKFDWSNRWNVRHQPAYLSQSACFRSSKGALSCLTCHDPHGSAGLPPSAYDAKCQACHPAAGHRVSVAGTACVTCHMPSVPATPEMRFTNHWIGVYGKGSALVPANASHSPPPLVVPPTAGRLPALNDISTLRPLFEQAVERQRHVPDSSKLAERLTALGMFFKETGNLDAAERALREALALERAGKFAATSESEVNLAKLLESAGRKLEAIELFRRAATGPDARAAAVSYESLAKLDPASAATYYEAAVAAEEKGGPNTPRVATQLSNLALAWRAKGEVGKAEAPLRRAVAIQENSLGPSHYQTAASLSNLGSVLQFLGKLEEAEALERQAFLIFEERLPHSLELAAVCANLAGLLSAKGDHQGAVGFWRLAISNDEAAAGADSFQLAADLENLANVLGEGEGRAEADSLLRRALAIYAARLGPESPRAREIRSRVELAARHK